MITELKFCISDTPHPVASLTTPAAVGLPCDNWCCSIHCLPSCQDPAARNLCQSAWQQKTCWCFATQSSL